MHVAQGCDGRLVIGSGFSQLVDFNLVKLRLGFGLLGAQLCDPPEQSSLLVLKRRELRAVCKRFGAQRQLGLQLFAQQRKLPLCSLRLGAETLNLQGDLLYLVPPFFLGLTAIGEMRFKELHLPVQHMPDIWILGGFGL